MSGAACQFLGGGGREVLVASVLGLGLGLVGLLTAVQPRLSRVFEPLAAFFVSVAAVGLAHVAGPLSVLVATIAGLIVLMPGLTLTTAMTELATRHLASGTARLSGAFITFLAIASAWRWATGWARRRSRSPPVASPVPLPAWAAVVALVVAPLCFVVILRAEPRDAPWIVAAGAIGVLDGGAATLGVELGTLPARSAVASSAYERCSTGPPRWCWCRASCCWCPAAWVSEPDVPDGAQGARGDRETAFSMILTPVALVAGLLIAGVIAPEPRMRDAGRR